MLRYLTREDQMARDNKLFNYNYKLYSRFFRRNVKMAAKIYYQEDCNLSLLGGKKDRNHRIRKPGTCTCTELERIPDVMLSSVFMREASPGQKAEAAGL